MSDINPHDVMTAILGDMQRTQELKAARDRAQAQLDAHLDATGGKTGALSQAHSLLPPGTSFRLEGLEGEYKVHAPRGKGTRYSLVKVPPPKPAKDFLAAVGVTDGE